MSSPANKTDDDDYILPVTVDAPAGYSGCPFFPTEGVVSREALQEFFSIGDATLMGWHKLSLAPVGPGTRSFFYFAEDVLRLLRANPRNKRLRPKRLPKRKPRAT